MTQAVRSRWQIDRVIAIIGLLLGSAFLFILMLIGKPVGLPISLMISCGGYLVLRITKKRVPRIRLSRHLGTRSVYVATMTAFVAFFALSCVVAVRSVNERPPIYFALMTTLSAIVVTQVVACFREGEGSIHVIPVLAEISAISIGVRLSQYLVFPSLIGADPFWHAHFVDLTIGAGHIPTGVFYTSFPLMHIEIASLNIISKVLDLKAAFFLAVGLFEALTPIAIYKLGSLVSDTRVSLLAALFLALGDQHSRWGTQLIPMSTGLSLFLLITILAFSGTRKNNYLLVLLYGATILTHTITSFIILVFLCSARLTQFVFPGSEGKQRSATVSMRQIVLYSIMFLSYWIYSTDFFRYSVFELERMLSNLSLFSIPLGSTEMQITPLQYDIDQIGMYILYALAAMGSLVWLSKENRNSAAILLTGVAATFLATSYGSAFLGSRAIVPERWLAFAYIPLAVLAAKGLIFVSEFLRTRTALALALLITIVYSFFMITSINVNMDQPFFVGKGVPRLGYLRSEIYAATILEDSVGEQTIFTDAQYGSAMFTRQWPQSDHIVPLNISYITDPVGIAGMVVVRKMAYSAVILVPTEGTPYEYSSMSIGRPFQSAMIASKDRIFDNGDVEAYSP